MPRIRTLLTELVNQYRRRYPTGSVLILSTLALVVFPITFALGRDLFGPNCDFLACTYRNMVVPMLVYIDLVVYLPLIVFALFFQPNPALALVASLFVFPYWGVISYVPVWVYRRLTHKPMVEEPTEAKTRALELELGIYFLFVFFVTLTIMSLLYYPRGNIPVSHTDFVITSSLIAVLLTLFFNKDVNAERNYESSRAITAVALLSISFLVLGLLSTFIFQIKITPASETTALDLASAQAVSVGSLGSGIFGLFYVILSIIWHLRPKRSDEGVQQKLTG